MIYLDTSYIVKCYVNEQGSAKVLELVQVEPGRAAGLHGRTEFWSAIQRHYREGNLSRAQTLAIWRQFDRDERQQLWHWLPLDTAVVHRSCRVIEQLTAATILRSSDALHLACAAENGFTEIYSNDKHLLAAAEHFGLTGMNVIRP